MRKGQKKFIPQEERIPVSTREITHDDGTVVTYYYDEKVNANGPYRVEVKHSKEWIEYFKARKVRRSKATVGNPE